MRRSHHSRRHRTRRRRVLVLIPLVLCVLAAVIASPVPRPEPAAAQSALPPPCTEIVLTDGIACNSPRLEDESILPLGLPRIYRLPADIGLVGLPTIWLYLAGLTSINVDVGNPGCYNPVSQTVWDLDINSIPFIQPALGAFQCAITGGGQVASYVQLALPTGSEVDFGSPDELGETGKDAGWFPAALEHIYEEKGVHPIEYRVYWREWIAGCAPLSFGPHLVISLSPPGVSIEIGWYCPGIGNLFFIPNANEVDFYVEDTMDPYQVDESRGTLEAW